MDDEELWRAYAWPQQSLRVNFVTSIEGHIQGPDGRSGTLSSPQDRHLFHMLRAGCDAVMVGAGTARRENYGPVEVKSHWVNLRSQTGPPALIMVSASGNVPNIKGAELSDGSDLREIKNRYPRILCEGGPHLFTELLNQGLVDELALSISPQIGGSGRLLTQTVTAGAIPKHAHTSPGGIFTLWDIT